MSATAEASTEMPLFVAALPGQATPPTTPATVMALFSMAVPTEESLTATAGPQAMYMVLLVTAVLSAPLMTTGCVLARPR